MIIQMFLGRPLQLASDSQNNSNSSSSGNGSVTSMLDDHMTQQRVNAIRGRIQTYFNYAQKRTQEARRYMAAGLGNVAVVAFRDAKDVEKMIAKLEITLVAFEHIKRCLPVSHSRVLICN